MTLAQGANADFRHTVTTTADRATIWRLWTNPATWAAWDKGLKSAVSTGPLGPDATGQITPLSGPQSTFTITEWRGGESYAFETKLPFATLKVRRYFEAGEPTRFTHHVTFSGPTGGLWASRLGPDFRRALPPTMAALAAQAELQTKSLAP